MKVRRLYVIDDTFEMDRGTVQLEDFKREFLGTLNVELEGYFFDQRKPMQPQVSEAVRRAIERKYDAVLLDVYFGDVGDNDARLGLDYALPRLADARVPTIVISSLKDFERTIANIYDLQSMGSFRYLSSDKLSALPECIKDLLRPGSEQCATIDFGFRYRTQTVIDVRKRIEAIFDKVARSYGSCAIEAPLCAPVSNFLGPAPLPLSERDSDRLFKAITPDGKALAVRYEGTALTAKWVAHVIREDPAFSRARFHYFQEMVRVEKSGELDHKHLRAFYQAGMECFASSYSEHLNSMAVVVQTVLDMFAALGTQPTLRFSHVSLIPSLLDRCDLQPFNRRRIIGALEKVPDVERVKDTLVACAVPDEVLQILVELASLRGSTIEHGLDVLLKHSSELEGAAREWADFYRVLSEHGLVNACRFDPGIYRSLDFYSGITMQGDVPGMAECLGGGDFTGLVEQFGVVGPVYSFGMAVGVERLMDSMREVAANGVS